MTFAEQLACIFDEGRAELRGLLSAADDHDLAKYAAGDGGGFGLAAGVAAELLAERRSA